MSLIVTKNPDGSFHLELALPEKDWVEKLGGNLEQEDVSIISIALGRGLIDLVCMFGQVDIQDLTGEDN